MFAVIRKERNAKMICEECGGSGDVTESRSSAKKIARSGRNMVPLKYQELPEPYIFRRTACSDCGHIFQTIEITEKVFDKLFVESPDFKNLKQVRDDMIFVVGKLTGKERND